MRIGLERLPELAHRDIRILEILHDIGRKYAKATMSFSNLGITTTDRSTLVAPVPVIRATTAIRRCRTIP